MAKPGPKGPWKYDKDFHPKSFVELSRSGKCLAEIAADWDITRETIYAWAEKYTDFSDAVKKGRQLCESWYMQIGRAAMLGQAKTKDGQKIKVELGFYVWMTKNICKWSDHEKPAVNVTVNPQITSSPKEVEEKLTKLVDRIKSRKKE